MDEKGVGLSDYPQVNQGAAGPSGPPPAAPPPVYGYDQPMPHTHIHPQIHPQGQMAPPGAHMAPPGAHMAPPGAHMAPPGAQMAPPGAHAQFGYNQPPQVVVQQTQVPQSNTTIVIQQGFKRPWSTELCGCCEDMGVCCMVYWLVQCGCGICYECSLAGRMGEECVVPCCVPGGLIAMRAVLRERHNIQGGICSDCLTTICCYGCVLCQMTREMQALGM